MKFVRFEKNQEISYGIVDSEKIIRIEGSPFSGYKETSQIYGIHDVKIMTPCSPSKIICVGLNFRDHAKELNMPLPREPVLFMKPPTALLEHEGAIIYPHGVEQLDYEAELAVIIKRVCYKVKEAEATQYIMGYTCFNDITARDIQKRDGQWTRAKSYDTFAPLGPSIATDINPGNLKIQLQVNHETRQSSQTSNMVFSPRMLISFISQVMTLLPEDVVACGTPPGVGPLKRGDRVEVMIEEVGTLSNTVQ